MAPTLEGLPQYIHDAVARIAPQQGFTPGQFRISFEVGSGKGDGFAGDMFRARITEDGGRELVVLCKVPPVNEARRQHFGAMIIFEREFEAYSKLLPAIYEFQRERGVTEELGEGFFNAPKCYLAYFEAEKEETAILMEDLRLRGYRMWNKMIPVDYEHVKLLMVQLGRLHAVSFAMKDQRPEIFESLKVSDPFSVMVDGNEPVMGMIQTSLERAIGLLNPDDKLLPKLLAFKSTLFQDLKDLLNPALCEPYAVLGHGDCWINNMIFSYKEQIPSDIVLLDWQICRYVSPSLDLLYFIFCCTDGDFRRQHYDDMIRTYHQSLSQLLQKLGGDPTRQFPYPVLLRQLRQHGRFGLLMAACLTPMLVSESRDLPDMEQLAERFEKTRTMTLEVKSGETERRYRKRMGEVLRDVAAFGYI